MMNNDEFNAHSARRAEVVAAWKLYQAGGEAAVSDAIGGVVIPLDQRAIVLDALTRKHGAWTVEESNFVRSEARRQLGI